MARAVEITFEQAVAAAEGTRQVSKASAFATYGFVAANLAAYITAVAAADVAYTTAVNSAANTSGILMGQAGLTGPIPTVWGTIAA